MRLIETDGHISPCSRVGLFGLRFSPRRKSLHCASPLVAQSHHGLKATGKFSSHKLKAVILNYAVHGLSLIHI